MKKQWMVPCRLEYDTSVLIEADTEAEARAKFAQSDWIDDGHAGASLVNCEIRGRIRAE